MPAVPLPLSICIPTFNRARLLAATLDRLAATPECFAEIVVADNASADDTSAVVDAARARLPALRYHRQAANRGAFPNFQDALSLGRSEYLFLLCDDDALMPGPIAEAVAALQTDPACVAVYGGYERVSAAFEPSGHLALPRSTGRFTLADLDAVAENANLLTFPVVRRTVFQRHCFFDGSTFGFVRLVAQLLGHGPIRVVGAPLYRHADGTADNMEAAAGEPWYQELLRADWELFAAASPAAGDFQTVASFVAGRVIPVYLIAHFAARDRDQPLLERSFLVRYLTYAAGFPESQAAQRIDDWERSRLMRAALARIAERLATAGPVRRLVVEQGRLNLSGLWPRLRPVVPDATLLALPLEAFMDHAPAPGDFRLAETWAALTARDAAGLDGLAAQDVIASLRLPGSRRVPMLTGPDGTVHFSLDR